MEHGYVSCSLCVPNCTVIYHFAVGNLFLCCIVEYTSDGYSLSRSLIHCTYRMKVISMIDLRMQTYRGQATDWEVTWFVCKRISKAAKTRTMGSPNVGIRVGIENTNLHINHSRWQPYYKPLPWAILACDIISH